MSETPLDPVRAEEVRSLVNLLDEILKRVVAAYEQAGVDLPDRRYWTMSTPVADCEQLTVFFNQAYIGPPGDEASEPQRCTSPRTAQIDIQVLRCIPKPRGRGQSPPTAEEIQAGSVPQAIDAWLLLDIASSLDTWDGDLPGHGLGVIATVDSGDAEGGYQGPTLHLTVAIP